MTASDIDDPYSEPDKLPRGVGLAATGLLLMKLALVCGLAGMVLGVLAKALPGILKLLALLPALLVLPATIVLALLSEVLCLIAPTRWRGRGRVLLILVTQGTMGAMLLFGDPAQRRVWTGIGGLVATAAMCLYLHDLATQFRRADVHALLRRFELYLLLSGGAAAVIREFEPRSYVLGLLIGAVLLGLKRGLQAYWTALTELRATLLAADAVGQGEGLAITSRSDEFLADATGA